MNYGYILKSCKPDNFQSQNSLKLSFRNIEDLHLNFVNCESFLGLNSPDILAQLWQFLNERLSSFNLKGL